MLHNPENGHLIPQGSKKLSRLGKAAFAAHVVGITALLGTATCGIYKIGEGEIKSAAVSGLLVAGEAVVIGGHAVVTTKIMDSQSTKK